MIASDVPTRLGDIRPLPDSTLQRTKTDANIFITVLIMGFVGYVVKLIHIPLNNILVGGA
jgi:hypothetical protein